MRVHLVYDHKSVRIDAIAEIFGSRGETQNKITNQLQNVDIYIWIVDNDSYITAAPIQNQSCISPFTFGCGIVINVWHQHVVPMAHTVSLKCE